MFHLRLAIISIDTVLLFLYMKKKFTLESFALDGKRNLQQKYLKQFLSSQSSLIFYDIPGSCDQG